MLILPMAGFSPFNQENVSLSATPTPGGINGVWVTLIGGGCGGERGVSSASKMQRSGGDGGGGGGRIHRIFIPASLLGPTYTIQRGLGGLGAQTSSTGPVRGSASIFQSGSVTLTANGGGSSSTLVTGGTFTFSGITGVLGQNGGRGADNLGNAGSPSQGAGAGGGQGSSINSNDNTVAGKPGGNGVLYQGVQGGDPGGLYGGGGSGSSASRTSSAVGRAGGDGYSLLEWV